MEVYGLEEKKAIERFKNFIYTYQDVIEDEYSDYEEKESAKEYQEVSEKILSLIKKESKEIEELKEENEKYKNPPFFDEDNYISKEEAEQKERKAYIKGTNDTDELCNKKWKDKIKAQIEELDKEEKEALKGTKGQDRYAIKQEYMYKRNILRSLLEKE